MLFCYSSLVRRFLANQADVYDVCFSPDGSILAADCLDGVVRLISVDTGKLLRAIRENAVSDMLFASDGKRLLCRVAKRPLRLDELISFDIAKGALVRKQMEMPKQEFTPKDFVVSQDGSICASTTYADIAQKHRIVVWDTATGKLLGNSKNARRFSWRFLWRYAHDSKFGYLMDFTDIPFRTQTISVPDGISSHTYDGDVRGATTVGKRLPIFTFDDFRMHDAKTGKLLWKYKYRSKNYDLGMWPVLSADGTKIVLASHDGSLRLASATTGKMLEKYPPLRSLDLSPERVACKSFAFSADLRFVAYGKEKEKLIQIVDWKSGKIKHKLKGGPIDDLAFSPDGTFLLAPYLSDLTEAPSVLWHVPSGKKWCELPTAYRAQFSPDGRCLCLASEKFVMLWDVPDRRLIASWPIPDGEVTDYFDPLSVSISTDNKWMTLLTPSRAKMWDVLTRERIRTFPKQRSQIHMARMAPDGRTLTMLTDSSLLIWDTTGCRLAMRKKPMPLSRNEFAALWKKLASRDVTESYDALWRLVASSDDAVAMLAKKIGPVLPVSKKQTMQLISDLNSRNFTIRSRAFEILSERENALPALRNELKSQIPFESRRRIKQLIGKLVSVVASPNRLRHYRTIQALEYIGTKRAKQLLKRLSSGVAESVVTRESIVSLRRLENAQQ